MKKLICKILGHKPRQYTVFDENTYIMKTGYRIVYDGPMIICSRCKMLKAVNPNTRSTKTKVVDSFRWKTK